MAARRGNGQPKQYIVGQHCYPQGMSGAAFKRDFMQTEQVQPQYNFYRHPLPDFMQAPEQFQPQQNLPRCPVPDFMQTEQFQPQQNATDPANTLVTNLHVLPEEIVQAKCTFCTLSTKCEVCNIKSEIANLQDKLNIAIQTRNRTRGRSDTATRATARKSGCTFVTDAPAAVRVSAPVAVPIAVRAAVRVSAPVAVPIAVRADAPAAVRADGSAAVRAATPATVRAAAPATVRAAAPVATPATVRVATPAAVRSDGSAAAPVATPAAVRAATPATVRVAAPVATPATVRVATPIAVRSDGSAAAPVAARADGSTIPEDFDTTGIVGPLWANEA